MLIPLLAYSIPLLVVLGVLGALVLLGFWLAGIYNRLVSLRARNKNAFAQIDVQRMWTWNDSSQFSIHP